MMFLGKEIGDGHPPFFIAEVSQNYASYEEFCSLADSIKRAQADAIKIQALVPDDMTIDIDSFKYGDTKLYDLYTGDIPIGDLFNYCDSIGLPCFASVYGPKSLEMCEKLGCPAYKISSFENNWTDFINLVRSTGKPLIVSLGFHSGTPILRNEIAMHCVSAYPTKSENTNMRRVLQLRDSYSYVGFSDHTGGFYNASAAIAAVTLGACMIEKHVGNGSASLDEAPYTVCPQEFNHMVETCRHAYNVVNMGTNDVEEPFEQYRRSIYVIRDIKRGEAFTADNIKVIRPGYGMHPNRYNSVLGRVAAIDLKRGLPLVTGAIK